MGYGGGLPEELAVWDGELVAEPFPGGVCLAEFEGEGRACLVGIVWSGEVEMEIQLLGLADMRVCGDAQQALWFAEGVEKRLSPFMSRVIVPQTNLPLSIFPGLRLQHDAKNLALLVVGYHSRLSQWRVAQHLGKHVAVRWRGRKEVGNGRPGGKAVGDFVANLGVLGSLDGKGLRLGIGIVW